MGEDSKIVRHNDKSLLPKELHVVHGMVWSNDIYGAKEVVHFNMRWFISSSTCKVY